MRKADPINLLHLPDNLLITLVTILCFNVFDEADIDDYRFSLQFISKKFYRICNSDALWQNKPIILQSGKFNYGVFKLIKKKSEGTEGICYHAYCRPHQKEYAVKRVSRIFSENEGVPYYMLRVLSALRNLQHRGVNELLYISLAGAKLYTIYPYVELTLQNVLDPAQRIPSSIDEIRGSAFPSSALLSPLKQHVAIDLMSQLVSAISYLHGRGILHRNLKPKHILIVPALTASSTACYMEGAVLKVSDFSLARTTFHPPRELTAEVITLWYRPPEILLGDKKYTAAVDIWSAGCIFAEMLEGRPLFAGLSEIDQLFQIFSKLGSPSEESSLRNLPNYQKNIFPDWDQNLLRNSMRSLGRQEFCSVPGLSSSEQWRLDDDCADLLNKCFLFEPSERISAEGASRHPCLLRTPHSHVKSEDNIEHCSNDVTVAADVPPCVQSVPRSMLQQHHYLRVLETSRGGHGSVGATSPRGLGAPKGDGVWEELGLSEDFAVMDWMIRISDQFSEFTCSRTVFLAGALMERFRRHCACWAVHGSADSRDSSSSGSSSSCSARSDRDSCTSGVGVGKDSCRVAGEEHLKLLGATCLHVASKLEDVSYVGVKDFLLLMSDSIDRAPYSVADILQLEAILLNTSRFEMYLPTVIDFLHIYCECVPGLRDAEIVQNLSKYLGELTLLFPSQFAERHLPSLVATAILSYSMALCRLRCEERVLQFWSKYNPSDIHVCVGSIAAAHVLVERKQRECSVYCRYDSPLFLHVAQLPSMSVFDRDVMLKKLRAPS